MRKTDSSHCSLRDKELVTKTCRHEVITCHLLDVSPWTSYYNQGLIFSLKIEIIICWHQPQVVVVMTKRVNECLTYSQSSINISCQVLIPLLLHPQKRLQDPKTNANKHRIQEGFLEKCH